MRFSTITVTVLATLVGSAFARTEVNIEARAAACPPERRAEAIENFKRTGQLCCNGVCGPNGRCCAIRREEISIEARAVACPPERRSETIENFKRTGQFCCNGICGPGQRCCP